MNKFNARRTPCSLDGVAHWHDSRKEALRCAELQLALQAGRIVALRVHPRWALEVNGTVIGHYTADFVYRWADPSRTAAELLVVEDVKSTATMTREYRRTKKHMQAQYGITVIEV